ncbi:MAG: hypothetical protein Tsb009_13800 [Planctomycetaceae bacterium]
MKFFSCCLLAVTFLVPSTSRADEKSELKKLAGNYKTVSVQRGGENAPARILESKLVVKGNVFTIVRVSNGNERKSPINVKLDDSKSPKHITLLRNDKPAYEGIYKYEKGKLTLCYNRVGKGRPKEFVSPEKTTTMLMVFQRITDKK